MKSFLKMLGVGGKIGLAVDVISVIGILFPTLDYPERLVLAGILLLSVLLTLRSWIEGNRKIQRSVRQHKHKWNKGDYHFTSRLSDFTGRMDEMAALRTFVFGKSDVGKNFSWWLVSGEAESGKSRLCLELCREIDKRLDWQVRSIFIPPGEFSAAELQPEEHKNTLIVIDQVERHYSAILQFLKELAEKDNQEHWKKRVRVLLIQRPDGSIWEEENWYGVDHNTIDAKKYAKYDALEIPKLKPDAYKKIMRSFAANRYRCSLGKGQEGDLYNWLKNMDSEASPTIAMLFAGSFVREGPAIQYLSKDRVLHKCLDESYEAEGAYLQDILKKGRYTHALCEKDEAGIVYEHLCDAVWNFVLLSVMCGGLEKSDFANDKTVQKYIADSELRDEFVNWLWKHDAKNHLFLEPNVIGEYIIFRRLMDMEPKKAQAVWDAAWERNAEAMRAFLMHSMVNHADMRHQLAQKLFEAQTGKPLDAPTFWFGGKAWLILDVRKGKALLLAKNVLLQRAYNDVREPTTWAECSLHKWLNDEDGEFFKQFNKSCIVQTPVDEQTIDYFFLMTHEELKPYFTWWRQSSETYIEQFTYFIDEYGEKQEASQEYKKRWVALQKEWTYGSNDLILQYDGKPSWWWLRSPGHSPSRAAGVSGDGNVNLGGYSVDDSSSGVRPALWLNLESGI
jgi:hypothetical protein